MRVSRPCLAAAMMAALALTSLAACQRDAVSGPQLGPVNAVRVELPARVVEGDTVTPVYVAFDAKIQRVPVPDLTISVSGGTALDDGRIVPSGDLPTLTISASFPRADGVVVHISATAIVVGRAVRVQMLPTHVLTQPGASIPMRVAAYTRLDSLLRDVPVALSSSDERVATVRADGVVTAVGVGSAVIRATVHGITGQLPIDVRAPSTAGAYPMTLEWYGPAPSRELQQAGVDAVARWQKVLRGAAPEVPVTLDAGRCGAGTPALTTTTRGIVVFISVDSVDGPGGAGAYGGPCLLRSGYATPGHFRPAVGSVRLDSADARNFGSASGVIAHEIGHALGIGTGWSVWVNGTQVVGLNSDPGGPDPRYLGTAGNATAAFWGFTPSAAAGIPIENELGPGSRDAHWRTGLMDLMDPYAAGPLSAYTAASLEDLGYTVDVVSAEPSVPLVRSTIGNNSYFDRLVAPAVPLHDEGRLARPIGVAGAHGTTFFGK